MRRYVERLARTALGVWIVGSIIHLVPVPVQSQGPRQVQGGLTADQIRTVIQRNIGQVQRCYELLLRRQPTASGRVTVAFMIAPNGLVAGAALADSTLNDAPSETCIVDAVRTWVFPRPDPAGPVSVRFPFNLTQSSE